MQNRHFPRPAETDPYGGLFSNVCFKPILIYLCHFFTQSNATVSTQATCQGESRGSFWLRRSKLADFQKWEKDWNVTTWKNLRKQQEFSKYLVEIGVGDVCVFPLRRVNESVKSGTHVTHRPHCKNFTSFSHKTASLLSSANCFHSFSLCAAVLAICASHPLSPLTEPTPVTGEGEGGGGGWGEGEGESISKSSNLGGFATTWDQATSSRLRSKPLLLMVDERRKKTYVLRSGWLWVGGYLRAGVGTEHLTVLIKSLGHSFKLASFFFDAFPIGHDEKTEVSKFSQISWKIWKIKRSDTFTSAQN